MKAERSLLFALHVLVGTGAVFGGLAAIINPQEPLGAPADILRNSPFKDFLIPGIILFAVIGLGNIFSAAMFGFKSKYQGYISGFFSGALVIWIIVQCIMIDAVAFMHILTFAIGLAQAVLSAAILLKERLFPTNIIMMFREKFKRV